MTASVDLDLAEITAADSIATHNPVLHIYSEFRTAVEAFVNVEVYTGENVYGEAVEGTYVINVVIA